jgi:dienelactone hydrolase
MSKIDDNVIIITDIYGVTDAVNTLREELCAGGVSVIVLDPYGGFIKSFADEQMAYQAFTLECGHQQYVAQVLDTLKGLQGKTVLLGFSAGASAAWKAVDQLESNVRHVIGFYPSQIRNHLDVQPICPVTLVFPSFEQHFDVESCIAQVAKLEQVQCIQTKYLHGFMNPLSVNFNAQGSSFFNRSLCDVDLLKDVVTLRQKLCSGLLDK